MQLPQVHQGVPLQDRAGRHDAGDHVGRHPELMYVLGVNSFEFQQSILNSVLAIMLDIYKSID